MIRKKGYFDVFTFLEVIAPPLQFGWMFEDLLQFIVYHKNNTIIANIVVKINLATGT